jgi:hypothetical protein
MAMKLVTPIKRNGMWYLRCRVPERYACFDPRKIIRVSTHIHIADDPLALRAAPIATQLYRDLEEEWRAKANGQMPDARRRYDDAVLNARGLGITYLPTPELVAKSVEEVVRRVEKLLERHYGDVPQAVSAALVVGEGAVDQLRRQGGVAHEKADFRLRHLNHDVAAALDEPLNFTDRLARHDDGGHDFCPTCLSGGKEERREEEPMAKTPTKTAQVVQLNAPEIESPPREPSFEHRRVIIAKLQENYLNERDGYPGHD